MNPLMLKAIAVLVVLLMAFAAGWRTKGAFVAEAELAAQEARVEMIATVRAEEGRVAALVEDRLKELRANERVIEKEKLKIVERPVYSNQCIDADGVQLINKAARGGAADPAKPADEVRAAK